MQPRVISGGGPGKVLVSNLDSEVTIDDLKVPRSSVWSLQRLVTSFVMLQDIFREVGTILQANINFDLKTGKHLGTATIVFETKAEAEKCVDEFDGVRVVTFG